MKELQSKKWGIALLMILLLGLASKSQELPKFIDGTKVCLIGNSITQDGRYHMLLQAYFATRFPGATVEFHNCGVAGDVADGMLNRLDRDILSHQPDYAFLMTGMNDIMQYLYEPGKPVDSANLASRQDALNNYFNKTDQLVSLLIEKDVKLVLMTPSIYDQTTKIQKPSEFGVNDALKLCAEHIRNLAKKYNTALVDLNPMMEAINIKGQKSDSTFTIIGHDRIHRVMSDIL